MATSSQLKARKIQRVLLVSTFVSGLGGSSMPFLFTYALIAEQGFSLHAVSLILITGPAGLLIGNRLLVPRLQASTSRSLMLISHIGFAASLIPIVVFPRSLPVILLGLFSAFVLNSVYLPARSDYIFFLGATDASSSSVDFRANLRFWSYLATGLASISAVLIITVLGGHVEESALVSNIATRLICAGVISTLPLISAPNGQKHNPQTEKPTPMPHASATRIVPFSYISITATLLTTASICGSFSFLLPLIMATFSIDGESFYPLLLGSMTIVAGVLHRHKGLKNLASTNSTGAVTGCFLAAGMAFFGLS